MNVRDGVFVWERVCDGVFVRVFVNLSPGVYGCFRSALGSDVCVCACVCMCVCGVYGEIGRAHV